MISVLKYDSAFKIKDLIYPEGNSDYVYEIRDIKIKEALLYFVGLYRDGVFVQVADSYIGWTSVDTRWKNHKDRL